MKVLDRDGALVVLAVRRFTAKMALEIRCSFNIAVSCVEFATTDFLEVSWLSVNKQLIEHRDVNVEQSEVHAHTY